MESALSDTPRDITSADVVIVGAGVVGSAVAYHLTKQAPGLGVVLVERDPTFAQGSTARSAGGLRQQFSTPENIALSMETLALMRRLTDEFGTGADVAFREQGYLILASSWGLDVLAANVATQQAAGADIELVAGRDLAARFPWLTTDGLAAGSFGRRGEGWIDPVALMTLLRKAALAAGVTQVTGETVAVERAGTRVGAVRLADGRVIRCGALVSAAGAWSGALARRAGIDLPVEPRKRYVYVIDSRRATDALRAGPLTVDISGVWMRPEGRFFLCGISPEEADEPPAADLDTIDYAPYEEVVWPTLAARVSAFEEAKVVNAWAGYYDYNTLDQNAVIGALPGIDNMYVATGFSGHGLQQGYAAGRAVAELITAGRFTSIDLTRFGYERIAAGRPLLELNVI